MVDATNTKTLGINAGNICEILPAINMKELKIPSIYKVQREAMLPLCKRPGISCLTRIKSSYASVGLGKNLPT